MEGGSWTEDAATSRAVRLCLSLAGSLAGLHRKTSRRGWERVTAAGVGIFLDWLTCRPQFGEGARGTGLEEFQHAMACVVEFANGIIRSAGKGGGYGDDDAFSSAPRRRRNRGGGGVEVADEPDIDPDTTLWEDEVRPGFYYLAGLGWAASRSLCCIASQNWYVLCFFLGLSTAIVVGGCLCVRHCCTARIFCRRRRKFRRPSRRPTPQRFSLCIDWPACSMRILIRFPDPGPVRTIGKSF